MDKEEKLRRICKWISEDTFDDELIEIVESVTSILGQHFPVFFEGGNVTDALLDIVGKWRDATQEKDYLGDELGRQLETYGRCIEIEKVGLVEGHETTIKVVDRKLDNGSMIIDLQIDLDDLKRYVCLIDTNGTEWRLCGDRWLPYVSKGE